MQFNKFLKFLVKIHLDLLVQDSGFSPWEGVLREMNISKIVNPTMNVIPDS